MGGPLAAIDDAIGRGHGDMRSPLDLRSLAADNRAAEQADGAWALTPEGLAWRRADRELLSTAGGSLAMAADRRRGLGAVAR